MSLLRAIFGSPRQPPPMTWMDEAFFGQSTALRDLEERSLRRNAQIREAVTFWKEQMTNLADKHAEAVKITFSHKFNKPVEAIMLKGHDKDLKIGYRVLLTQSDTRWGTKITNEALRELNHDDVEFRWNAEKD